LPAIYTDKAVPPSSSMPKSEMPARQTPLLWNEFPCFDFVDSEFTDHAGSGRRFDRLSSGEWQGSFLAHWGWKAPTPASPAKLKELFELRLRLRRLLAAGSRGSAPSRSEVRQLNQWLAASRFTYAIASGNHVVAVPVAQDWNAVVAELVRSALEVLGHDASRVRECANPDCNWMFYDESLNRTRRWCQTNVCGNMVRVREYRRRQSG
jgi:predicted RNA-binding Zn ribbon-like protein